MDHFMYFIGKVLLNMFNSSMWTIRNIITVIAHPLPALPQKMKLKKKNLA